MGGGGGLHVFLTAQGSSWRPRSASVEGVLLRGSLFPGPSWHNSLQIQVHVSDSVEESELCGGGLLPGTLLFLDLAPLSLPDHLVTSPPSDDLCDSHVLPAAGPVEACGQFPEGHEGPSFGALLGLRDPSTRLWACAGCREVSPGLREGSCILRAAWLKWEMGL